MHEAVASDLVNPGLLAMLYEARSRGVIGAFGVGTKTDTVSSLLRECPEYCDVLQFPWSIIDPQTTAPGFLIHHGTVGPSLALVRRALVQDPALTKLWSDATGKDIGDERVLAALLLKAALEVNRNSLVLFWTRSIERIERNAAAAEDNQLTQPAIRLWELSQAVLAQAGTSGT
jgi:hypothetical protein